MIETQGNAKPPSRPAWWGTAVLFSLCAVLVAAGGFHFSRKTERVTRKPDGSISADHFRQMIRRIDSMESLWEQALTKEAARLLDSGSAETWIGVNGVVQYSRLNPALSDGPRAHHREDGVAATVKPVLEKFARKEPGEWVLDETILTGSGWLEVTGKPQAWVQGNGRSAVLLLLDASLVEDIVNRDLKTGLKDAARPVDGMLRWTTPSGKHLAWLTTEEEERPDEVLRHVSRFGDWTMEYFYPAKMVTHHETPLLAGSLVVAGFLVLAGAAVVARQRKATRIAEQQVSFVNRVSHELRTPLTNLLLNTDLALDGLQGDEGKMHRRLTLIREETSRLSRLVDNVQTFDRLNRGAPASSTVSCDVAALVEDLRAIFAPLFERKSIRCEFDCQVDEALPLDADALSQILSNLFSNIEKYAGEGASARVTISLRDGTLRVEVEDTGPGIPAHARKRVFLPFERAGSRVDEGASGAGLGLAISRDLASKAGGSLELIPSPLGAKFLLMIPLLERSLA